MDWKQMANRAKRVVDQRGGSGSVKQDAAELRNIAQGDGTLSEKLGRAAKAIKEPGASHDPAATGHGEAAEPAPAHPESPVSGPPTP